VGILLFVGLLIKGKCHFLQTRDLQINESDVEYSSLGNVGYPNYFFNTERPLIDRIAGDTLVEIF
jgi:hypothetical protein